ncbi:hypothetical protein SB2_11865 [Methylobacterium radiotolerans]|nr:hypothetical protein SB3_11060 [Methylobacterium radiotolerans]KTS47988.1 hypothetical protein SB2_11865 [Methylobacterium radiotolerans]
MRVNRFLAAAAAIFIAVLPAHADQILGPGRITSGTNKLVLPGGPTLGTYQNGQFTSQPYALQIGSGGATGPVSAASATATGVTAPLSTWFQFLAPIAKPVVSGGQMTQNLAIGGNRGDIATGLQIGGGVPEDGPYGVTNRLEGNNSWQAMVPTSPWSSMEFALHTGGASGLATGASGTSTLTWVAGNGNNFDPSWVGRKIYFNGLVLRVASVASDRNSATIMANNGSAYTFPANVTEVFKLAYVHGVGTANVSGNTVTRVAGDPFLLYYNDPAFEFRINGAKQQVTGFTDTKTITLANNLGNLTNATYEFFWDANDQITTLRLHTSNQDVENLSIYTRYDGFWYEAQYGAYGKYRDLRFTTAELPYSPGSKTQQLVLHRDGGLSLGGDYGWDVLRILPQTFQRANYLTVAPGATNALYGPSVQARGSDANVNLDLDTQGNGTLNVSSNSQNQLTFQVFGTTTTGLNWAAAFPGSIPGLQANGPGTNVPLGVYGKGTSGALTGAFIRTADPTTSDIPAGACADWQNTTAGTYKHVCNFGGTLRSVAMN